MKFNVYSYIFAAEVVIGAWHTNAKLSELRVACLYSLKGLGKGWCVRKASRLLIKEGNAINNWDLCHVNVYTAPCF